jgi:hypothetical protein
MSEGLDKMMEAMGIEIPPEPVRKDVPFSGPFRTLKVIENKIVINVSKN